MNASIWVCPSCRAPLLKDTSGLVCREGHRYDRAKQGYVNLLLANQKNSADPGDNQAMISARRRFLNAGHYQFLVEEITRLAGVYRPDKRQEKTLTEHENPSPCRMLDLGCGEGYYLSHIRRAIDAAGGEVPFVEYYGTDISKFAVKKAASLFNPAHTAVASNFALPIGAGSVDLAMCVFSPLSSTEMLRVLSPEGVLIRVSPGPFHLQQVKQVLYDKATLHDKAQVLEGFCLLEERQVSNILSLDGATGLSDLLEMTPLNWHGKQEAKTAFVDGGEVEVDADFYIQVMKKR